jgi:hypothetical protein
MGSSALNDGGSGDKWYADWTSGDETCKNDGGAPDYSEYRGSSLLLITPFFISQ